MTSVPHDPELFHKLLQLGVRPISDDCAFLTTLGFAPHYEQPKTRHEAAIWSRTVTIGARSVTQYAYFQARRSSRGKHAA
jgi:hypothetical protein